MIFLVYINLRISSLYIFHNDYDSAVIFPISFPTKFSQFFPLHIKFYQFCYHLDVELNSEIMVIFANISAFFFFVCKIENLIYQFSKLILQFFSLLPSYRQCNSVVFCIFYCIVDDDVNFRI